ncbi:lysine exporter LysO family protein [Clostridiaceae bacterium 35-E11]
MTISIIVAVILGMGFGLFIFPETYIDQVSYIIDFGLCTLLFFVGIDMGRNKNLLNQIKANGLKLLILPVMIGMGSIIGSIVGGTLLGMPFNESSAIGAGFGWYTLSAIELSKYSAEVGALAFITNVSREIIALISIPFIAKYIGKYECIASAAAPSMDTCLPVISEFTDANTSVVAFVTGVLLSSMVPILVPLFIQMQM